MAQQIPYKTYLDESEMPKQWYNLRADMKNKPAPLLNPATLKPMTAEELSHVFCDELVKQELTIPHRILTFPRMSRILQDVPSFSAGTCLLPGKSTGYASTYLLQV